MNDFSVGTVAIIGKPNVGKSTLLNALLREKLSITANKPQTTRDAINGIQTTDAYQIIYVDTPGLHQNFHGELNRHLNKIANLSLFNSDLIIFVATGNKWNKQDDYIVDLIKKSAISSICVLNKIDLMKDKAKLLPVITHLSAQHTWQQIIPISAKKKEGVLALEKEIVKLLPSGEARYPDDYLTDKSVKYLASEIIREKLTRFLGQELPYVLSVEISSYEENRKHINIAAIIWIEKDSQKGIIIGKKGEKLKTIGTQARLAIEDRMEKKTYLNLWVKVKHNWTDDLASLRSLGYK